MPDLTNFTSFKVVRDLKAYLYLKAGVTRGPLPDPQLSPIQPEKTQETLPKPGPRSKEQAVKERPPFFIVGHGKSGTTWLARLLDAHPEILCLWEGRFFNKAWYREDLAEMEARVPSRSLYGALSNSQDLRLWLERSVWSRSDDAEEPLANLTRLAVDYFFECRLAESGKIVSGKNYSTQLRGQR
jgi:hypothetical protein